VRAVILDKDNDPQWGPQASGDQVEGYFRPLPGDQEMTFLD